MSELRHPRSLQRVWLYLRLGFFLLIGLILWFSTEPTDAEFHLALVFWFSAAGCDFLFSAVPAQYRAIRSGLRLFSGLCGMLFVAIVVLQLLGNPLIEQWLR